MSTTFINEMNRERAMAIRRIHRLSLASSIVWLATASYAMEHPYITAKQIANIRIVIPIP